MNHPPFPIRRSDGAGKFRTNSLTVTVAMLIALAGCQSLPPERQMTPTAPGMRRTTDTVDPAVLVSRIVPADLTQLSLKPAAVPLSEAELAALPDLWARIRARFALDDLDTPDVEQFAQRFARSNWLERLGPRARLYLYYLVIEAEKRHLPSELALLPIIESGLNPQAHSPANAVGLCQFIPQTGRRFGLHQSALSDKRKDLTCVASMFDYLAKNSALFNGDWHLALASYNWGEGAVGRAIERNQRDGLPTNYLALRMPGETRGYVPQLLAIKRLIADPARYAISLPRLENHPTIACDVRLAHDMDIEKAARFAGIQIAELRALNPGVRKDIIPRATHPTICLPFESAVRFVVNSSEHKGPHASWSTHTVASRTTLVTLAKRYHTTADVIRSANDIPVGMRLKAGATVLVPRAKTDGDIPLQVAMTAITTFELDVPDTRKITIKAKRKDSLAAIAKRHGVRPESVKHWNPGLKEPFRVGQQLVLHVPVKQKPAIRNHIKAAEAQIQTIWNS